MTVDSSRWEKDDLLQSADPAVVGLLSRTAQENGIDLAPWWRENAPRLAAAPAKPVRTGARIVATTFRYAAILAAGVALGGFGPRWFKGAAKENSAGCGYSPVEQKAMFAVLDAAPNDRAGTLQRLSASLAGCVACHPSVAPHADRMRGLGR